MLEKFLVGGAGYILLVLAVVLAFTIGIMSLLLPFFVFKIMTELTEVNRKLGRIMVLLSKESREPHQAAKTGEIRLGPVPGRQAPAKDDPPRKPLRFQ